MKRIASVAVAHPPPLPEIAINLFRHARHHKDPANEWLRGVLIRLHVDRA